MTRIRLLPVVVMAIAALLVLKTVGLVTNGGYVLAGIGTAQAAGPGAAGAANGGTTEADLTVTPASEPTLQDTNPTLSDDAPTMDKQPSATAGNHGEAMTQALTEGPAAPLQSYCVDSNASLTEGGEVIMRAASARGDAPHGTAADDQVSDNAVTVPEGSFAGFMAADCLPSGDVIPLALSGDGTATPLLAADGTSVTEQQLLERLTARRGELLQFESDLAMRASIVGAAEKRIEERTATLEALEAQISTLVDQREALETGQFAGIVAMYEVMKAKDAAKIFNNLDMDVLLRVAKTMSPRKMAPILAEMDPPRAQELTVRMAAPADAPAMQMTPDDLAALPQIVGQ